MISRSWGQSPTDRASPQRFNTSILLETLKARTTEEQIAGLGQRVETDNPATRLYKAARFTVAEERQGDQLMLWRTTV